MDKNALIELTNKLYRLSLLFPKKEPLRYKIREVAIEILTSWTERENLEGQGVKGFGRGFEKRANDIASEIQKNLDVLNSYFEVAKWQNWVNFFEILDIQKEYEKITPQLKEETTMEEEINALLAENTDQKKFPFGTGEKVAEKEEAQEEVLEPRKKKIMDLLQGMGKVQVREIKAVMPDISKRTLRRDFQYLLKKGMIERIGEKNNTFYRLKGWDNGGTDIGFNLS